MTAHSPFFTLRFPFFILLFLGIMAAAPAMEVQQKLTEMTFEKEAHDWKAERNCRASLEEGVLRVEAVAGPPILSQLVNRIGGRIEVVAEIRTLAESSVNAYWTTRSAPRRSNENMQSQPLTADGQWHEYRFQLPVPDFLTSFTFRFTATEGIWDIRKISVLRRRPHPITLQNVAPLDYKAPDGKTYPMMRFTIYNDAPVPLDFRVSGQNTRHQIAGRDTIDLLAPLKTEGHLAAASVLLQPDEFPAVGFPVFRYVENGTTDWITLHGDSGLTLEIDPTGRMARIKRDGKVVAAIAPLVHRQGVIPSFTATHDATSGEVGLESEDATLSLGVQGNRIRFVAETKVVDTSDAPLEGPAVRVLGTLRSGLLSGVEFLGPGDVSSSAIDIEAPNNQRSTPPREWITMPLAVLETENGAVAMRWKDMTLLPTFASPNSFDRTDDHRMSLIGSRIEATLAFLPPAPTGESAVINALQSYVREEKFPEPPPAPRNVDEQLRLSLRAMQGPLRAEDGLRWAYALGGDAQAQEWPRQAFADMLSTTVRLLDYVNDARIPKPDAIVPGGADIANDTIYFLTGQVEQWRAARESAIRSILELRNPDGSFLHRTRFPEVETAASSYGHTAIRTLEIMEFIRLTGSKELFELIKQSLEYLSNCEVPRGGFYRGDPLHTPDLLTAATLTWLYTWAYEYSGDTTYLERAKRFALLGLPFVYQWKDTDATRLYVTVPKFGGTGRHPPLWFAVSQPRVGLVYAYALQLLAKHDTGQEKTGDWRRVAEGILHAAESLQFTDGPETGCVPQAFDVRNQERRGWHINPCALTSLRLALDGKPDSLVLFMDGQDRYVSPYPLRRTTTGIEAYGVPEGRAFQVLRNGSRIISATGPGLIYQD